MQKASGLVDSNDPLNDFVLQPRAMQLSARGDRSPGGALSTGLSEDDGFR